MRYKQLRLGTLAAILLLAGCSNEGGLEEAVPYVPPAWMAQYQADREEATLQGLNCLEEKGFDPIYSDSATIGSYGVNLPEHSSPQMQESARVALEDCFPLTQTSLDGMGSEFNYETMLDTHACLVAKGFL